jgi:hypothetical protein
LYLLEDVGHGGGKMAGVEGVVVNMTGAVNMENDVRKER